MKCDLRNYHKLSVCGSLHVGTVKNSTTVGFFFFSHIDNLNFFNTIFVYLAAIIYAFIHLIN